MNDIDLPNLSRSEDDQHNFREKRFFINKNRFVALSVSTTFVFCKLHCFRNDQSPYPRTANKLWGQVHVYLAQYFSDALYVYPHRFYCIAPLPLSLNKRGVINCVILY
jgi:hypothetical protein